MAWFKKRETIEVSVQDQDIRFGKRRSYCECPIARAIARTLGYQSEVWVDGLFIRFNAERRFWRWRVKFLPSHVRAHLDHYDSGGRMRPFTFSLTLPRGVPHP